MKLTHYGWPVSPFSCKTKAYLDFKGFPYRHVKPTATQLFWTLRRAVGRPVLPTVQLAGGGWLQDTSAIIDAIEAKAPGPSVLPRTPRQRVASALLELFADEWLPLTALHYRWNVPENARFAVDAFAGLLAPRLPLVFSRPLARRIADRMQRYNRVFGIDEDTIPGIEALAQRLIAALDAHLVHHPYLLGRRPCIGDFALFGPLWGHLYRDPGTTRLFAHAPAVVHWMTRLHEGVPASGGFLPGDDVPDSLDPVFSLVQDQLDWLHVLIGYIDAYCTEHPRAKRVPRALGTAPFTVQGRSGRRKLVTFMQWKAQRVREAYELANGAADPWLERVYGTSKAIPAIRNPFKRVEFKEVLANSGRP